MKEFVDKKIVEMRVEGESLKCIINFIWYICERASERMCDLEIGWNESIICMLISWNALSNLLVRYVFCVFIHWIFRKMCSDNNMKRLWTMKTKSPFCQNASTSWVVRSKCIWSICWMSEWERDSVIAVVWFFSLWFCACHSINWSAHR